MNRGESASSPSASRSCRMLSFRTASVTKVPGHTASSSCCFVTSWPACSTRCASTAKAFGLSGIACTPWLSCSFVASRRNPLNVTGLACCITETPPQHDRRVMTTGHDARYSRLVMKALQLTRIGRLALAMVPAILLTTATLGAQSGPVERVISTDGDTLERLLRGGVFDEVNESNRGTSPSASTTTSPSDDRLRWLTFYLIFTDDELSRY